MRIKTFRWKAVYFSSSSRSLAAPHLIACSPAARRLTVTPARLCSSESGGPDKESGDARSAVPGGHAAEDGVAAERLEIKLVRGGRMVGRRPEGFTLVGKEFTPTMNWSAYIVLVGMPG